MIISILSDLNEIVSGIDSAKTPVAYATGPDIMIDLYISKLIETGHYSLSGPVVPLEINGRLTYTATLVRKAG